ncbi:hypothetical protein SUGI_0716150 [Cryptomeria japonica]|nr:hypothetical protein SUGI_0716150 [Cryptomeria japonica]
MMLPASFRQLINLQYICLLFCSELTLHPDILENTTKLEAMLVSGCELQELPAQTINQQSLKTLNVGSRSLMELPNGIGHLSKLEALIIGSSSLKSLPPSIGNLSSLTRLEICSEKLESLPETLTQLTSLHSLQIRGCTLRELDILSGSLETLIVHAWWKVPVITSLENMESLRSVELLAWNDISTLEHCLQTIKKWPECIICASTACDVEVALKSFTFSGLTLVDSWKGENTRRLTLQCRQRRSSNAAAILCFVINSLSHYTHLGSWQDGLPRPSMTAKQGQWVWIGVFTQSSPL